MLLLTPFARCKKPYWTGNSLLSADIATIGPRWECHLWNIQRTDQNILEQYVVKPYVKMVIAAIRERVSDNLIIVGSLEEPQKSNLVVKDLVIGYNNIACSLHFCTVHHHSNGYRTGLRQLLTKEFRFSFSGLDWGCIGDTRSGPKTIDWWNSVWKMTSAV